MSKKYDKYIALGLFIIVLILSVLAMKPDTWWGDDFAAYLLEGIAISEGKLDEQTKLNLILHPSTLPPGTENVERLTYVWGYPLVLSVVHKIFGYSREAFNILPYMLPNILILSLIAPVMYFFSRRYAKAVPSAVLTLLFCLSPEIFDNVRNLYGDFLFILLTLLCFLLAEKYFEKPDFSSASLLGLCFFATYETRLSGITIIGFVLLMHAVTLIKNKSLTKNNPVINLLPYLMALALVFIFDNFVFYPATKNTGDYTATTIPLIITNVKVLLEVSRLYILGMIPTAHFWDLPFIAALLISLVAGVIFNFKKLWIYILFVVVTAVGVIVLPYSQGLRYYYNLLPFVFVFAASGASAIYDRLKTEKLKKTAKAVGICAGIFLSGLAIINTFSLDLIKTLNNEYVPELILPYNDDAKEMYRYIMENTEEDAMMEFSWPRVLYLNTGRVFFQAGVNGRTAEDADYILKIGDYGEILTEDGKDFELISNIGEFYLYGEQNITDQTE